MKRSRKPRKGLSAGKPAEGRWRVVCRKIGGPSVLLSPDGREFEGTAAEVRACAATPCRRRMLAESLRYVRFSTSPGTAERAKFAARRRFDAIAGTDTDAALGLGGDVPLPPALAIRAEAAARLGGTSICEWVSGAARELVRAVAEANGGVLPLTRHERAALERMEGRA